MLSKTTIFRLTWNRLYSLKSKKTSSLLNEIGQKFFRKAQQQDVFIRNNLILVTSCHDQREFHTAKILHVQSIHERRLFLPPNIGKWQKNKLSRSNDLRITTSPGSTRGIRVRFWGIIIDRIQSLRHTRNQDNLKKDSMHLKIIFEWNWS